MNRSETEWHVELSWLNPAAAAANFENVLFTVNVAEPETL